jgi:hypothetical protein
MRMTDRADNRGVRIATVFVTLILGVLVSGTTAAAAAESDGPSDEISCVTYFPSAGGTDTAEPPGDSETATAVGTGEPTDLPSVSGAASDTATAGADTGLPTQSDEPTDPVSDSGEPTDLPSSDSGGATDGASGVPSGPVTACVAAAGGAAGGAEGGSTAAHHDPLARSGSDTTEFVVLAVLLLALGVGLSVLGGRAAGRRGH